MTKTITKNYIRIKKVEHSFSRYKAFQRDNRHRFVFSNIRKHLVMHCNANINDEW